MDFMKDIFPLLRDICIFGFIVWGVLKIVNNSSERKFADYKKYIEKYRSELKFLNGRLASLHSERLIVLKELNDKLVKLNAAMMRLVAARPVHPDPERDKKIAEYLLTDTQMTYFELNNFILLNKIYFDKSFAEKLQKIRNDYFEEQWDFFELRTLENMGMTRGDVYRDFGKKIIESSKRIREQIPPLIAEVEDEFRTLSGIQNRNDI